MLISKVVKNSIEYASTHNRVIVLFQIDVPIIWSFEYQGQVYIAYSLRNKKMENVRSFVYSKTSYQDIIEFLNGRIPLNKTFSDDFEKIKISNLTLIREKFVPNDNEFLPSNNFRLINTLPNEIDPADALDLVDKFNK